MNKKFDRFLSTFPKLKQRITTRQDPKATFLSILRLFERAGFHVAAVDNRLMRFCAYRSGRQYNCTCVHVIWVRSDEETTCVSYGIEPHQGVFLSCGHRDHVDKLHECGRAVHKAIDEIYLRVELPREIVNGRWHVRKLGRFVVAPDQINPRSAYARSQFANADSA